MIGKEVISKKIYNRNYLKLSDSFDFDIEELRQNYNLQNYHIGFLKTINSFFNLKGKTVLEIGGSNFPMSLIKLFEVKNWVCVDIPWWTEKENPEQIKSVGIFDIRNSDLRSLMNNHKYFVLKGTTDDMTAQFNSRFDFVFSLCCFEHIANFQTALKKIYDSLIQGGILFSRFSPIYSAFNGSHFYLPEIDIVFGNKKFIPDFAHLLLTKRGIVEILRKNLRLQDNSKLEFYADKIKYGVNINRYFYEDYDYFFEKSDFKDYIISPAWTEQVSPEVLSQLIKIFPEYKRFDAWGIELYAQKIYEPEFDKIT